MSLLEVACKAHWNAARGPDAWDKAEIWQRVAAVEAMRSAIMALASADIPQEIVATGAEAIVNANRYGGSSDETDASVAFDAMLRAIARSN